MKARKYFILVSENLKSSFYKTEKSVKTNLEKQPFQKKFTFDSEQEAIKFQQDLTQCSDVEKFKQLEFDYGIAQQLKQYEQKIMNSKAFREDDVASEGVSINLRRPTHIYVLWDKNSKPQIYFGSATAKKNSKPDTEMKQFLQPSEAIAYIKQILEFLEKNKIHAIYGQDDEELIQEQSDTYQNKPFFQNDEAKLFSLDQHYKQLLSKHVLEQMKEIKIDYSKEYAFRCSSFNTVHFHSAIGVSLINLITEEVIRNQGVYVLQRKPSGLLLLSVLFGLRYSIFLQIPSITFQIAASQDYQFLNKMTQPSQPLQKMTLDAINNYSQLLKSVEYQLVDKEDCQDSYQAAVKAFQKFAYLNERSKKFRHDKSSD